MTPRKEKVMKTLLFILFFFMTLGVMNAFAQDSIDSITANLVFAKTYSWATDFNTAKGIIADDVNNTYIVGGYSIDRLDNHYYSVIMRIDQNTGDMLDTLVFRDMVDYKIIEIENHPQKTGFYALLYKYQSPGIVILFSYTGQIMKIDTLSCTTAQKIGSNSQNIIVACYGTHAHFHIYDLDMNEVGSSTNLEGSDYWVFHSININDSGFITTGASKTFPIVTGLAKTFYFAAEEEKVTTGWQYTFASVPTVITQAIDGNKVFATATQIMPGSEQKIRHLILTPDSISYDSLWTNPTTGFQYNYVKNMKKNGNKFATIGVTENNGTAEDFLAIIHDESGNKLMEKWYPMNNSQGAGDAILNDNYLTLCGGNKLAVQSYDIMIVKYSLDTVSGLPDWEETNPEGFYLKQNYPNPFNSSTVIEFYIPRTEFVNLSIYDILGKKVAEPINATLNKGKYRVLFNGGNLASGTYLYMLKTNTHTHTEVSKMVLIK